jgi:hypothetical protein
MQELPIRLFPSHIIVQRWTSFLNIYIQVPTAVSWTWVTPMLCGNATRFDATPSKESRIGHLGLSAGRQRLVSFFHAKRLSISFFLFKGVLGPIGISIWGRSHIFGHIKEA